MIDNICAGHPLREPSFTENEAMQKDFMCAVFHLEIVGGVSTKHVSKFVEIYE